MFALPASTARLALQMIYVLCGGIWLSAFNNVIIVALLRTGGDVRSAAVIDVGTLWAVGVPMALLAGLVLRLELPFVYLATYLEQVIKAVVGFWRYRQGKWVCNIIKEDSQ